MFYFWGLERLSHRSFGIIIFVLIVISIFLLYGPSLKNGFAWDDERQIVHNPYIKSLIYLPKAFTSCIWEASLPDCKNYTGYYRPTQTLSYLFTYATSSKTGFFHLVNLIYYIVLNCFIFLFLKNVFRDRLAVILSLLIFLFLPVHSETVFWIAGVPELLSVIFIVAAFWVYLSGRKDKYRGWLMAVLFFAALISKEPAVFLPFILLVYDRFFKNIPIDKEYFKRWWRYGAVFVLYLIMRISAIGLFERTS